MCHEWHLQSSHIFQSKIQDWKDLGLFHYQWHDEDISLSISLFSLSPYLIWQHTADVFGVETWRKQTPNSSLISLDAVKGNWLWPKFGLLTLKGVWMMLVDLVLWLWTCPPPAEFLSILWSPSHVASFLVLQLALMASTGEWIGISLMELRVVLNPPRDYKHLEGENHVTVPGGGISKLQEH